MPQPFGEGHGNPLQYSCLKNPMDRGVWWATVHGVAKSRTRLKQLSSSSSSRVSHVDITPLTLIPLGFFIGLIDNLPT